MRHDQPGFVGGDDCLGPVPQPELAEHAADVCFDGFFGDDQLGGYLRVGQARGYQPQNLRLARGEPGERSSGRAVRRGLQAGELADEAAGDAGGEQRVAQR